MTNCDASSVENFLWVEKWRPKRIADCILTPDLQKMFESVVSSGEMQNFLLCGGPGCGKTTVAKALCEEMNLDYLFINASEFGNIDTLRTTVRGFASTVSLSGGKKVVILDEADYLNPQSTQPALRGFIEEFSKNCRFILTCNFKNKIIEPLQSRCAVVDFSFSGKDKQSVVMSFYKRVMSILDKEKVVYDKKVVAELLLKYYPDFRRIIGELQRFSSFGPIDSSILVRSEDKEIEELLSYMKEKNFSDVRKWVAKNLHLDHASIFRKLYDVLSTKLTKSSIPSVVLILAEYQYKMAFSADAEICLAACMAEVMLSAEFQ